MASPQIYQSGIGGTTGATLATSLPLYMSGNIWYVSSATGVDAASPRGKERIRPLATLAQAVTNAAAGDIIVCLAGHLQSLSATQTLSLAGLTIVGEGTLSTRPKFTRAFDVVLFDITAAGVSLINLYWPASTAASTAARVRTAAATTTIDSCYGESGANDTGPTIETVTGAGQVLIRDTTLISTATVVTAQPESAITVTNAMSDLELDTVVIDGGVTGWSNPYALRGTAAITRLKATNLDLLNDSDVILATGSTGYIHVRNTSGSARVVWDRLMASPNIYKGGLGGTATEILSTRAPLYTSGNTWYVHSGTGVDAASPAGQRRYKPLATLVQAITNLVAFSASTSDIIVCLAGHVETFSSTPAIQRQGTIVVGEGTGASRPAFTRNASGSGLTLLGADMTLDNLRFVQSPSTAGIGTVRQVVMAGARGTVRNCTIESGPFDPIGLGVVQTDHNRVINTQVISVATSSTDRPGTGIEINTAVSYADMVFDHVVVDGGAYGWATSGVKATFPPTRMRITNLDLLNDSDISLPTGTTGYLHVRHRTGSSRIEWAA